MAITVIPIICCSGYFVFSFMFDTTYENNSDFINVGTEFGSLHIEKSMRRVQCCLKKFSLWIIVNSVQSVCLPISAGICYTQISIFSAFSSTKEPKSRPNRAFSICTFRLALCLLRPYHRGYVAAVFAFGFVDLIAVPMLCWGRLEIWGTKL